MKNKELIEHLKTLPEDLEVVFVMPDSMYIENVHNGGNIVVRKIKRSSEHGFYFDEDMSSSLEPYTEETVIVFDL